MSSLTPLGFTREYQAYRAANTTIPFPDSRLLAAVRFWSRFPEALASDSYSSFWLEDLPPLLAVDARVFDDLHPDELAEIATFIAGLDTAHLKSPLTAASLWEHAARKWLYVGQTANALDCLTKTGLNLPKLTLDLPGTPVDPHLIPRILIEQIHNDDDPLQTWLSRFDANWRAIRESGHTNQATCVLVERDAGGKPVRGRLRTLEAHIEALPKGRDSDEVVFGHQLCTADDPQVRGAYAAVASLRHQTQGSSIPQSAIRNPQSHFRARFTFANDNREPYGGDSLAFACFTAAYGDWWSKDLHRERRLVATQVALTGALKSDGQAERVAENSLEQKIERVFFSPLSYLVVPQSNRAAAEGIVAALHGRYPSRRLRIITTERAGDLISDGNITIPERVCLGEYAVRAAAKYTRSLKVQVPILVILCMILGWLSVPKLRAISDNHLTQIEQTRHGFVAKNRYGYELWKKEYPVESLLVDCPSLVYDLDGDGESEALFFVSTGYETPDNAMVDVFNSGGGIRFRLDPTILAQYPGDYESGEVYTHGFLQVVRIQGKPTIVTAANAQNPSRFHIRIWSAVGDSLGWYVNAGIAWPCVARDFDVDGAEDLLFPGFNIRMRAVSIFVLRSSGSHGAAPPYWDSQYDLAEVLPGNQLNYIIFPITDLTEAMGKRLYNMIGGVSDVSSRGLRFDVFEGGSKNEMTVENHLAVNYYLDSTLRVSHVDVDDSFKVRRENLVRSGSLPAIPWPEYFLRLKDTVTYWTPSGWLSDRSIGQGGTAR